MIQVTVNVLDTLSIMKAAVVRNKEFVIFFSSRFNMFASGYLTGNSGISVTTRLMFWKKHFVFKK